MIAVMGAAGNTGQALVRRLLKEGRRVRALGRNDEKLTPLLRLGAQAFAGDAADPAYLTRAFAGAEAVYAMIPPETRVEDYTALQDRLGESVTKAVRDSGVRRVVFLSSLGAELPEGTGPIVGLHRQENRLRNLPGVNVLVLRPGSFFENHYFTLGLIRQQGVNGGAIAPGVAFPQIATRDIAEAAAEALLRLDFSGVTVKELLGPRDLSQAEATRILGEKIGKPDLAYVQFPDHAFIEGMTHLGISRGVAHLYTELSQALNEGRIRSLEGRNPRNTTPTTFESFAETLAAAYAAQ
jgi:uncharacterized protein YbjT (DUF2867 family)